VVPVPGRQAVEHGMFGHSHRPFARTEIAAGPADVRCFPVPTR
jgi:hypothetical protein